MEFIQNSLTFVDETAANREEVLSYLGENTLPPFTISRRKITTRSH